jgi:outer membrane protein OmpA-like peptidoglycan-associated protein
MKHILFILYFLIVGAVFSTYAQEREIKKLTHEKKHKVAHKLIDKSSYYNAVDQLNDLVKEHPQNKKYLNKLADAYFHARDYRNAEIWYEKVTAMEKKEITEAHFRYAETLKYNAKYEEAKSQFSRFANSKFKDHNKTNFKKFALNEVGSCEYAIKNRDKTNPLDIVHLGDHVNSKYSEFSPALMNDTTLVFASLQSDSIISVVPDEAHTFHVKLLTSVLENDIWGQASEMPVVNTVFESNANGTFSADKKRFYFTRCVPNANNRMVCKIYVSELKDSVFQKPKKLDKYINVGHTTQPCIGTFTNGKTTSEVLFFVSNRKGSIGGLDIWYSVFEKTGKMRKPQNLGRAINTIRDEATPFYESKSGILYFSSNYHFGFGGYDVFKSTGKMNQWTVPQNIGKPINTRVDDTYYSINRNTNEGFFVSNRPEGYHLTSETCCDDIYSFNIQNPFLLNVIANNYETKIKLDSADIVVYVRNADEKAMRYNADLYYKSDTSYVDSVVTEYRKTVSEYLGKKDALYKKEQDNVVVDKSFYPELKKANRLFSVEPSKEYLVYAYTKTDTAFFTFTSSAEGREVSNAFKTDTSEAEYDLLNAKKIDLVTVNLFLKQTVKIDTVKLIAVKQDEKTFTVGKLMEDMKKNEQPRGLKVILNYDFDDANFIKDHAASLDSMVAFMTEYPELKIFVSAHTDNKGSDRYNNELSNKRAKSIENYLQNKGISKKRMKSKGYGETQPIAPNTNEDGSDNPENRYLNRRAEVVIEE